MVCFYLRWGDNLFCLALGLVLIWPLEFGWRRALTRFDNTSAEDQFSGAMDLADTVNLHVL
jgi:hypothetical protein